MRYQVEISKKTSYYSKVDGRHGKQVRSIARNRVNWFPKTEGYQRHVLVSDSGRRYLKAQNTWYAGGDSGI
ncbi:hypothetical protein O9992_16790 [Vibrio lentus]|nr:hypothetical protein [Vibrio lentus]